MADKAENRIELVKSRYRKALGKKAEITAEMQEADRFYQADHWDTQKRPSWRPNPVANFVFLAVEHHAANLALANPVPILKATEPGDEAVVKLFQAVVEFQWHRTRMREVLDEVIQDMLTLGTGFVKVYWDNSISGGRPEEKDGLGNVVRPGSLWKGDVACSVVDPANVFVDPGAYKIGAAKWVIIAAPRSLAEVKNNPLYKEYAGSALNELKPEKGFAETEIYPRSGFDSGDDEDGMVLVYEQYEIVYDKDGKRRVDLTEIAGNVELRYQESVFAHGRIPLVRFLNYRVRKRLWGMGEAKQILPKQKLINQIEELEALNAMLTANNQKLVDANQGIDLNMLTNEPGLNIPVRDTATAIKPIEIRPIPNYVHRIISDSKDDIREIANMQDVYTGEANAAVRTFGGTALLQERAATRNKRRGMRIEEACRDIVELWLGLMAENYTEARFARIVGDTQLDMEALSTKGVSFVPGPDGKPAFVRFRGADLLAELNIDVQVNAGSGTPVSKALIAQQASTLLQLQSQYGFNPPLITLEEYLNSIDFPNKAVIIERLRRSGQAGAVFGGAQGPPGAPPGPGGGPPAPGPPGQGDVPGGAFSFSPANNPENVLAGQLRAAGAFIPAQGR